MTQKDIQTSIKNHDLLEKRRDQIVMTATKLFMSKGFEGTSVREIAKACDLTVGGLYRYVGSKDDILWLTTRFGDFAGENLLDTLRERVKGMLPVEALRESVALYFRTVERFQDLYNFHNHIAWTASREFRKTIFEREIQKVTYFTQLIEVGVKSGDFVVEDANLAAHNIILAGNAWANRRWFLRKNYSLDDYIRKETDSILKAIRPWGCDDGALSRGSDRDASGKVSGVAGSTKIAPVAKKKQAAATK